MTKTCNAKYNATMKTQLLRSHKNSDAHFFAQRHSMHTSSVTTTFHHRISLNVLIGSLNVLSVHLVIIIIRFWFWFH